ncbi:MAG TPA: hypothetical protein VGG49_13415 [Steroidobacteraceae bacterium]|jgi:hypothetical protein
MGYAAAGLAVIVGGGMLTGKGPAGSLKPKTALSAPPVMPDQTTQNQAATLAEAQAAAERNGRASTILTSNSNTSDQLGP